MIQKGKMTIHYPKLAVLGHNHGLFRKIILTIFQIFNRRDFFLKFVI